MIREISGMDRIEGVELLGDFVKNYKYKKSDENHGTMLVGYEDIVIEEVFDVDALIKMWQDYFIVGDCLLYPTDYRVEEYGVKNAGLFGVLFCDVVKCDLNRKTLLKEAFEIKKDYDARIKNFKYTMHLDKPKVKHDGTDITIYTPFTMKPEDTDKTKVFKELSPEDLEFLSDGYEKSIFKYIRPLIVTGLYRKFFGKIKQSILHLVTPADSAKSWMMDNVSECLEVYKTDIQQLFVERAKVDANKLTGSLFLVQDEATVLFQKFKLLEADTLQLNLAYARRQVEVDSPYVVLLSADDAQTSYSTQFQARLTKIYCDVINMRDFFIEAEKRGINNNKVQSYFYKRTFDMITMLVSEAYNGDAKYEEVMEFLNANQVEKHDPVEMVKMDLANFMEGLKGIEERELKRLQERLKFELGTDKEGCDCLIITGKLNMKKKFLKEIISDEGTWYELGNDYSLIGFDLKQTGRFNIDGVSQRRANCYFIKLDAFEAKWRAAEAAEVLKNNDVDIEEERAELMLIADEIRQNLV